MNLYKNLLLTCSLFSLYTPIALAGHDDGLRELTSSSSTAPASLPREIRSEEDLGQSQHTTQSIEFLESMRDHWVNVLGLIIPDEFFTRLSGAHVQSFPELLDYLKNYKLYLPTNAVDQTVALLRMFYILSDAYPDESQVSQPRIATMKFLSRLQEPQRSQQFYAYSLIDYLRILDRCRHMKSILGNLQSGQPLTDRQRGHLALMIERGEPISLTSLSPHFQSRLAAMVLTAKLATYASNLDSHSLLKDDVRTAFSTALLLANPESNLLSPKWRVRITSYLNALGTLFPASEVTNLKTETQALLRPLAESEPETPKMQSERSSSLPKSALKKGRAEKPKRRMSFTPSTPATDEASRKPLSRVGGLSMLEQLQKVVRHQQSLSDLVAILTRSDARWAQMRAVGIEFFDGTHSPALHSVQDQLTRRLNILRSAPPLFCRAFEVEFKSAEDSLGSIIKEYPDRFSIVDANNGSSFFSTLNSRGQKVLFSTGEFATRLQGVLRGIVAIEDITRQAKSTIALWESQQPGLTTLLAQRNNDLLATLELYSQASQVPHDEALDVRGLLIKNPRAFPRRDLNPNMSPTDFFETIMATLQTRDASVEQVLGAMLTWNELFEKGIIEWPFIQLDAILKGISSDEILSDAIKEAEKALQTLKSRKTLPIKSK